MVLSESMNYAFKLAFWHTFGDHAGESSAKIRVRKRNEIRKNGWTLWSFRKMKMLEDWVHHLKSVQQPRVLVFCSDRGGKDPLGCEDTAEEIEKVECQSYRLIGERSWTPICRLKGVSVPHPFPLGRGCASAFVVRRVIHPVEGFEGSSIKIEWLNKDSEWRSGPTPTKGGLPTRGEFLIRPGGIGTMRGVGTILELESPYLAEVSTDPA